MGVAFGKPPKGNERKKKHTRSTIPHTDVVGTTTTALNPKPIIKKPEADQPTHAQHLDEHLSNLLSAIASRQPITSFIAHINTLANPEACTAYCEILNLVLDLHELQTKEVREAMNAAVLHTHHKNEEQSQKRRHEKEREELRRETMKDYKEKKEKEEKEAEKQDGPYITQRNYDKHGSQNFGRRRGEGRGKQQKGKASSCPKGGASVRRKKK